MNFLEALKSGKDFRHPNWKNENYWFHVPHPNSVVIDGCEFSIEDLCSNDFEVREEKIEITRSQLIDAHAKAFADIVDPGWSGTKDVFTRTLDYLGFKS